MKIIVHLFTNNYTRIEKINIEYVNVDLSIDTFLNYLYDKGYIETTNYKVYHLNQIIDSLPNSSYCSLILKDNKEYLPCSCYSKSIHD